jgi:hypothetical protein
MNTDNIRVNRHPLDARLETLREAAALPLQSLLHPYESGLSIAALNSIVEAWQFGLIEGRDLDPPEDLLRARLRQARKIIGPKKWGPIQRAFVKECWS